MDKKWMDDFCNEIKKIVINKYKVGQMINPALFKTYQQECLNDNKYWLEDIIEKYRLNKNLIEEEEQSTRVIGEEDLSFQSKQRLDMLMSDKVERHFAVEEKPYFSVSNKRHSVVLNYRTDDLDQDSFY